MQKIKVKVISNLFSLIVLMVVILYGNISIAENLKLGERYVQNHQAYLYRWAI